MGDEALNKYAIIGIIAVVALSSALAFLSGRMYQEGVYRSHYQELLNGWLFYGDLLFKMNLTSMEPTISIDDVVIVENVADVGAINVGSYGDIIVFYKPKTMANSVDALITHRAINRATRNGVTYFRTKGDANTTSDFWTSDYRGEEYSWQGMVSEKLLVGKVVDIVPSSFLLEDSVPYMCAGARIVQ